MNGGRGGVRGMFADTAHFETVYTNNKGETEVKFKLPDNVTKYRITAHAVNEDLYVGVNTANIVSTLDFFIQSVEPRNVKTTDDLVLNATSIATEKYDVDYEFTIKELNKTLTATATTNSIATVNFGKLKFGTYHVVIKGKGKDYEDAIEYEFNVIESSQEVKNKTTLKINETAKISPNKNPISLEIYNKNMEQYLKYIDFIEKTVTPRLDTQIAYNEIIKIKNEYYQTEEKLSFLEIEENKGYSGFSNLPSSKEDLLLTALISYYAKDYYVQGYFEKDFASIVSENTNLFEIYLLAAANNESVLKDLMYLKKEKDIDNYNKLLLTLSFEFLGDYQTAKDYYRTINLNEEERNYYKSITATIETFIDKTNAVKKINEMVEENPADEYLRFAILSFFKNSSEELNKEEKVEIICGNKTETITLKGMQVKTYSINNEELKDINFKTTSDDLMVSYYYNSLLENLENENIVQDIQMDLYGELKKNNEVYLDINFNDFKEGDIRIALPNSLRLALSQEESLYYINGYYLKNNNIDYIVIHKNENCGYIELPLVVVYEGNYKFENVVMQEEGTYHISNSFDLDIE